jgi:outer membrane protein
VHSRRRFRMIRALPLLLLPLCVMPLAAQQPGPTLSLQDALRLARGNNPEFLARSSDAINAEWAVRSAYASLLPGASASTSFQYQAEGPQRIGNFTGGDLGVGNSPAYYLSGYSLGLNYQLSGATLLAPRREQANRRATEAGIESAAFTLAANVTRQYLAVLRNDDAVLLARQELERAGDVRRLAEARVAVGSAIPLEVMQAEVQQGRAEVALLQAENLAATERLRLMQTLGIEVAGELQLTSDFPIVELPWTQEALVAMALQAHPQLQAARATAEASETGVRIARSQYLPTVDVSAGLTGYTRQAGNADVLVNQARIGNEGQRQQCETMRLISAGLPTPLPGAPTDCSAFVLTAEQEARIRDSNSAFPFNFRRDPVGMQLRLSLPIFQGLNRERQIEAARVAVHDAHQRVRGEELRLKTEVSTALLNARTAQRTVALEERNRALADEQLRLARERYRVGASSFLDLQEAETAKARADRAHLVAVYSYHEALAGLENAVGRPLREIR